MSFGARLVWIGVALAVVLGGCRREQQFKPQPKPAEPLAFARTTPDATVSLRLWPSVAALPGLRYRLYQDGVRELTNFAAQAKNDRAHLIAKGIAAPPYRRAIDWRVAAATPRLAGAEETWFDDTGGAHPNHGTKGMIWDVLGDTEIERPNLFLSGVNPTVLNNALCNAIKAAKIRRMGPQGASGDASAAFCPNWSESDFTLAPSTVKGKIGGVVFLFDPYVLGPYAAGGYEVVVPQSAFHYWLNPAWKSEFEGDPAPAPTAAPKR